MAMAMKRTISTPNLLNKIFHPIRSTVIPSSTRFFSDSSSSSTQMQNLNENERGIDIDRTSSDSLSRRRGNPTLFSDVLDPFTPSTSLSSLFNMMDNFMDSPFTNPRGGVGGGGIGLRRGWDAREDENCLCLKIDMPGLSKEEVNVSVDQNTLSIKGEGGKESDDEGSVRRYSSRIDLPPKVYKLDEIRAEMKNGVLKVFVPKVKEEERSDVVQVNVE
ncbi:hypothetical protein MKX01_029247 [Papaver californicum]|nr:hypothetical protein MKX01_029247 [Papaver californicum]